MGTRIQDCFRDAVTEQDVSTPKISYYTVIWKPQAQTTKHVTHEKQKPTQVLVLSPDSQFVNGLKPPTVAVPKFGLLDWITSRVRSMGSATPRGTWGSYSSSQFEYLL